MDNFTINYENLISFYVPFAGLVFYFIEKFFPERSINYKKELKNDLLAFCMLLILGPLCAKPLASFYESTTFLTIGYIKALPTIARILLASILTDFLNYWVHYCMHKYNWYWRSHLFHHRIQNLYWFSGLRASVTHYLSFILVRITVGALVFRLNPMELFYYFAIGFTFNSYQHTNSKTGFKFVEWIFVTPRVHRLHHSSHGRKMKNIGTVFTVWDRLFGTYLDPDQVTNHYELGIKTKSNKAWFKEFLGI